MSITSALIRSTIDKIKKDLNQLEDWLNSLHSGPALAQEPSIQPCTDVSALLKRVDELTNEVQSQKHTIHHLVDRLDVMEATREIHIDGCLDEDPLNEHTLNDHQDPWITGSTPLQNEIIDPLVVNIHKEEDLQVLEEITQAETKSTVVQVENTELRAEEPESTHEKQEEIAEEQEEDEEEEPESTHEKQEENAEEENAEEQEENAEEEEEEEGVELEEIIVKGVHYYKDPEEGFIYEIDSEGQPSEQPIGVWKTKTQTISFYRST